METRLCVCVCVCKYCICAVLSPALQDMCVGVISVYVFPSAWTLIKSRACSQCRLCESRKSHTTAISHPRTSSNVIALLAQRSLSERGLCVSVRVCVCVLRVWGNYIYVLVHLLGVFHFKLLRFSFFHHWTTCV